MANPFVHIELNTTDLGAAKAFYSQLFDWQLEDTHSPIGAYTMIKVGNGTGGAMMTHPMRGAHSHWIPYVAVNDIHASTTKARELGANILIDSKTVEGGAFTVGIDPTGAAFGLWMAS